MGKEMTEPGIKVSAAKCERIQEKEYDAAPYLYDGWEEWQRKDGWVYIVRRARVILEEE